MRALASVALLFCLGSSWVLAQEGTADLPEVSLIQRQQTPVQVSEQQQRDRFYQHLLTTKISLDVTDAPLEEVTKVLSRQLDMPIWIFERSLEWQGLTKEMPVTFHAKDIVAETLLRLMLGELDLTYCIESEGVIILTQEEAEKRLVTRVYPVDDLVDDVFTSNEGLKELIRDCLEPQSWSELGGPGGITIESGSLCVRQTYALQVQLERLLKCLRTVKALPGSRYSVVPQDISPLAAQAQQIREQLRTTRVTVSIQDTPLEEIVEYLGKAGKFSVQIDNRALEDVGLTSDIPVTIDAANLPLQTVLDRILEERELCRLIDGDVLVITTPIEQEGRLHVCVYPVRDLVWRGLQVTDPETRLLFRYRGGLGIHYGGFGTPNIPPLFDKELPVLPHYESLVNAIERTIEPDTWEVLGGPGSMDVFGDGDCLVISQMESVHQRIEQLLADLRAQRHSKEAQDLLQQFAAANAELITQSYSVTRPEQLKARLEATIEPESWDGKQHFIDLLEKKLVIRHRRDIQRQIYRTLMDQGEVPPLGKHFPTWKSSAGAMRGDNLPGGHF